MLGQYIKDLSFESPAAPEVLQTPPPNPQLQVTVNVNAASKSDEDYEVILNIEVHAKSDTGVIYNVELFYGGMFRLRNVPQNMLQPVLFIDCPTLLFPFVRRVLADVTRDGGFPPLMLDPIDFGRLYAQNLARAGAGPGGEMSAAQVASPEQHAPPQGLIAEARHEGLVRQPLLVGEPRGKGDRPHPRA